MLRKPLFSFSFMLVIVLATGCIGGPGPEDFAGTWQGTETATATFEGESDTTVTPNTSLTLSEGSSADVIFDASGGENTCILRGNIEDETLVFESTSCAESDGGVTLTFTISGEATLVDDEIQIELNGPITATGPGGSIAGNYIYDFEGERL